MCKINTPASPPPPGRRRQACTTVQKQGLVSSAAGSARCAWSGLSYGPRTGPGLCYGPGCWGRTPLS
jgi:hypothetical protein